VKVGQSGGLVSAFTPSSLRLNRCANPYEARNSTSHRAQRL
jgi:hypothetical protein